MVDVHTSDIKETDTAEIGFFVEWQGLEGSSSLVVRHEQV